MVVAVFEDAGEYTRAHGIERVVVDRGVLWIALTPLDLKDWVRRQEKKYAGNTVRNFVRVFHTMLWTPRRILG